MRAGERRMTLYEKRPRFLEFGEMIIKIEVVVNGKNRWRQGDGSLSPYLPSTTTFCGSIEGKKKV